MGASLRRLHPGLEVRHLWVESEGDQRPDEPLARLGGKGLFAGAVERALRSGEADLAVHSMKDLPAAEGDSGGLRIAAVPMREDVRDCLISRTGATSVEQLPPGAVLGTSGPRRAAQALRLRPDLRIKAIRGNVETRLRKATTDGPGADGVAYDATLLAMAGLKRSGLAGGYAPLSTSAMLPAAGQGALALQCRSDDAVTLRRVLPLNHAPSAQAAELERAVVAALAGDCHSPIAAMASFLPGPGGVEQLRLQARVLSPDGGRCCEADVTLPARRATRLVREVLKRLREAGAEGLLRASA